MVLTFTDAPDSKVHGANMGPTWVLPAPDGPHVGPMNLVVRGIYASVGLNGLPVMNAYCHKMLPTI